MKTQKFNLTLVLKIKQLEQIPLFNTRIYAKYYIGTGMNAEKNGTRHLMVKDHKVIWNEEFTVNIEASVKNGLLKSIPIEIKVKQEVAGKDSIVIGNIIFDMCYYANGIENEERRLLNDSNFNGFISVSIQCSAKNTSDETLFVAPATAQKNIQNVLEDDTESLSSDEEIFDIDQFRVNYKSNQAIVMSLFEEKGVF